MRRAPIICSLVVCGSLNAVCQPLQQTNARASFDCAKTATLIERTICADPELTQWDGRMGQAFKLKYTRFGTEQRRALLEDQRRWIVLRNNQCNVAAYNVPAKPCILQLTKARIATLDAAVAALPTETPIRQAPPTRAPSVVLSVEQMERNRSAAEAKEKRAAEDRARGFALLAARNHQSDPNSITVDMSITVTSANPPMIKGTTNLPDGTTLWGSVNMTPVKDGLPACSPNCVGYSFKDTTVESGCFTSELKLAKRLAPGGSYTIYIGTFAPDLEPQNVQSAIGKYGEHLYGPYVVNYDANSKMVPAKYPREWNAALSDIEKFRKYFFIYYTQEIHVDDALNGEVYAVGEERGALPACR